MEECEPAPHLLHPYLAVRKRRLRQVRKGAGEEQYFVVFLWNVDAGPGWSAKRGIFMPFKKGRKQKVTNAVKGRSKTPAFHKISGWMSNARLLWHVFG